MYRLVKKEPATVSLLCGLLCALAFFSMVTLGVPRDLWCECSFRSLVAFSALGKRSADFIVLCDLCF